MWPFTRKPKPINPGPINEDWRVGDLAECIIPRGDRWHGGGGPENGDVLCVTEVHAGRGYFTGRPGWFLGLKGEPLSRYDARYFRKVPPLNTEASAEFTAKIRACKPAHRKAPTSC